MTKNKSKRKDLTKGNLKKQILAMTLPMIFGMLGMLIFNFVDAIYIAMLGETELAAIAFTFPVVMVVTAVSQGLAMGTGTLVSAFVGQRDENGVRKTATYALVLSFIVVGLVAILGNLTITPLFTALGATSAELPYVNAYMRIWYFGVPFVVIPMVGNNIIRALGDTRIPSLVMLFASVLNMILDPILIFGLGFTGMGIAGAAIATVISRFTTFVMAGIILTKREKVLSFKDTHFAEFKSTCKNLLHIAIPTAITRGVYPLGTGVIIAIVARFGVSAVAGYGAGVKLEALSFSVIQALAVVMVAVTGQNFGAKQFARIKAGHKISTAYALSYSVLIYPILFFAAPLLAQVFDVSDSVRQLVVQYVRIATVGAGFFGVMHVSSSLLNAIKKPMYATIIFLVEMFGINIPLALILSKKMGLMGVFYATVIAYVLGGILAYATTGYVMKKHLREQQPLPAQN